MAVTNNTLGGVILAGDSWLSGTKNTQRISEQIGQPVTNVAVGGFTTQDTINQLNSFLQGGGTFAPNSTVMLDVGGNDLLQNVNPQNIKSNLQQLVSTLGNNGVKVILSGAPEVSSVSEVKGSKNLQISNIFKDVAQNNPNVTLVDSMSGLLNQKNLVDETGFHLNEAGQTAFNAALSNAYLQSQGLEPIKYSEQAIKDFIVNNNLSLDQALSLAPSFSVSADRVRSALTDSSAFNANNVTPVERAAVGVSGADLAGVQNNGYSVKATPTEILTTMKENNLSPAQMAAATGLSEGAIVSLVAETLPPGQNVNLGGTWVQPVYDSRGQGETFEQGPLKEVLVYNQNQQTGDAYKQYSPTGEYIKSGQFKDTGSFGDLLKDAYTAVGPIAMTALTAGGAGGLLGGSLGLTGTAANVVGGALLGGGNAALTGNNVLQGAVLGGASGYVSSLLNAGVTDPDLLQAAYDADVAGGMVPEFGTNAAYDSFMQAAMTPAAQAAIEQMINQPYIDADMAGGLTPQYGSNSVYDSFMESAMTPEAKAAIEQLIGDTSAYDADVAGGMVPEYGTNEAYDSFMESAMTPEAKAAIEQTIANSSVAGMTPEQILQQGDMITDIASGNAMGPVTAEDLGKAFEEYMAQGGYTSTPETGALGSTVTAAPETGALGSTVTAAPETTPTVETPAEVTTGSAASTLGGLTASQIANLLKAGVSLAALSGAANAVGGGGGGGGAAMQTPTQGVPTNSPNYYNQLQQYYNAYLPQTPRDVVAPLQQWYEGSFGSTGTNTAISPQQAQTAMPPTPSGTVMPTAPVRPTTPTPVAPTAPTSVPMAASTGLFNTPMTAQQQVQNLLSNPNLSNLPPEAAAAISRAVSAPRSYNDVVASGGQNTVDVSSLSPEVQRAYDLYQQSMILGANSSEVRKAYERAGVNPTNPDAFFAGQGLLTDTPTQAALAQYAPLALDRFAKSGGGALTFTVDPSTLPPTYTAPAIPDISFNMDRFIQSINNNTTIGADAKQRIIAKQAAKRGFNPSEFI